MIVVALAFYAVVGLFVGAAILHWLGLLPEKPKPGQHPTISGSAPAPKTSPGVTVFIVACAIGLPLGLAWLGGTFGSGNALFSKGGGSSSNQPTSGYQPTGSNYQPASGPVWVNGYYRQDGTYVPGHYRTRPDGDPSNNWSNQPNVNPYTGKPGTHQPR
jgi:hypothetical protein